MSRALLSHMEQQFAHVHRHKDTGISDAGTAHIANNVHTHARLYRQRMYIPAAYISAATTAAQLVSNRSSG